MKLGMQTFAKGLGEEACYFLDLLEVAHRLYLQKFPNGNQVKAPEDYSIKELMELTNEISFDKSHLMDFNISNFEDSTNYFVHNAPVLVQWILKKFTGNTYVIGYEKLLSKPSVSIPKGWVVLQEWKWKVQHFRFAEVDSLLNSQTVKNGELVSYRCFYFK